MDTISILDQRITEVIKQYLSFEVQWLSGYNALTISVLEPPYSGTFLRTSVSLIFGTGENRFNEVTRFHIHYSACSVMYINIKCFTQNLPERRFGHNHIFLIIVDWNWNVCPEEQWGLHIYSKTKICAKWKYPWGNFAENQTEKWCGNTSWSHLIR